MRYLRFNHGNEIPRSCWFVDLTTSDEKVDTQRGIVTLTLGKIYASHLITDSPMRQTEFMFDNPNEFWDMVAMRGKRKRSTWLFIYDPYFTLDMLGFWKLIDSGRVRFVEKTNDSNDEPTQQRKFKGCICMNSTPFFVRCMIDNRSITIVSVNNYGENLSSIIREHKKTYSAIVTEKTNKKNSAAIVRSVLRGLVGYFASVFAKWKAEDIGCWQTTASRLAMRAYQHHLKKTNDRLWNQTHTAKTLKRKTHNLPPHPSLDLIVFHDDLELKQFEREGYFGGESQLFYCGKWNANCHVIDIRSFYPWIATQFELPYQFVRIIESCSLDYLKNQLEVYEAIAEVEIGGPNTEYPVRIENKNYGKRKHGLSFTSQHHVIYPEGIYWTKLTSLELRNAIESGHVRNVGRVAFYKKGFILRDFMNEWIEKRQQAEDENDHAMVVLAKLIANSLIGKFGQYGVSWKEQPQETPPINWGEYWKINWDNKTYSKYRSIGGYAQKYVGITETQHSFIPIPAAVCAIGRTIMRSIRRQLPMNSVLLQNTDGFVLTDDGLETAKKLLTFSDHEPGTWRIKGSFSDAEFWTPQHYRLGENYYLSGVNRDRTFDGDEFIFYEQTNPLTSVIMGLPIGKAIRQIRQFSPDIIYSHREKLPNGFTVPPLLL